MTPTSATGAERRARTAGLTLVELMIVLVILGLAATAVIMTLPDPRPSLAAEAEVLAARLVRAREEAVLTNRTIEVTLDETGYAFRRRAGGAREPMAAEPFAPRTWTQAVEVDGPGVIAFDPTGLTPPARVVLARSGRQARIVIDDAGEVSVHAG